MRSAPRLRSTYMDWPSAIEQAELAEPPLCVENIMSRQVLSCHPHDTLNVPAQLMWDHDCGSVAVIDDASRVVGMITDRDVCMAAYTQGKSIDQIGVASACSKQAYTCQKNELVSEAARIMERMQVRRLPVVDADEKLVGLITLSDLARHARFARGSGAISAEGIASLLQSVSQPRSLPVRGLAPMPAREKELLALFDSP